MKYPIIQPFAEAREDRVKKSEHEEDLVLERESERERERERKNRI